MKLPQLLARLRPQSKPRSLSPTSVFLMLGGGFGLLFAFITPAFQVPDEPSHFYRAYQISQGDLLGRKFSSTSSGGIIPTSLVEFAGGRLAEESRQMGHISKFKGLKHWFNQDLKPEKREAVDFANTVLYSPINYAPQAFVMAAGRVFDASPVVLLYLSRLAALAAWLALIWLSIRVLPYRKWFLVALALLPMTVSQAASASADGMVIGLTTLALATFLAYLGTGQQAVNRIRSSAVIGLALLLGFLKQPYGLVVLILLLGLRRPWFRGTRNRTIYAAVAITLVVSLSTTALVQAAYVPITTNGNINPGAQVHGMISHPQTYLFALGNTFFTTLSNPIYMSFVGILGWLTAALPLWIINLSVVLLIAGAFYEVGSPKLTLAPWLRRLSMLLFIGLSIIMATLLYISWTPVGGIKIEGIQGRYFLPIALLLLPAFVSPSWVRSLTRRASWYLAGGLMVSLVVALVVVYYHFYGSLI